MRSILAGTAASALALAALAGEPAPPPGAPAAGAPAVGGAATERLADFFWRTKGVTRFVPAVELWQDLHAGTRRFFVVDVRTAEDYAKGHVPGAINLPIDVLFRAESLARIPAGRPLLLVCKTGHVESMALGGLAALGYEPYVLHFGMMGWDAETRIQAGGVPGREPDVVRGVGGPIER